MISNPPIAVIGLLLTQEVAAQHFPTQEEQAAFQEAVDEYQIFVVPHCAPDEARAYITARFERDRAFIQSLRKTALEADYRQAVADRAEGDQRTVYECMGPLLSPPSPLGTPSSPVVTSQAQPQRSDTLAEHFAAADSQFATLVRLRNSLVGAPLK